MNAHSSAPSLTLIVSAYNQTDVLAKTLRGIELQTQFPDEVLVADDGSGPVTREIIEGWAERAPFPVRHVWHPDDGFRKTIILNKALAEVRSDYVVFTDADCVPHPAFVADHRRLAERGYWVQGRRCFVQEPFVPAFDPEDIRLGSWALQGRIKRAGKGVRLPSPIVFRDTKQRGIIGCNLACWRVDAEIVNGFDEAYTGWGIGEDSDFGSRLYHLGIQRKLVYGHAVVFHLNHPMPSRAHLEESQALLEETWRTGRVRCEIGLDQYRSRS